MQILSKMSISLRWMFILAKDFKFVSISAMTGSGPSNTGLSHALSHLGCSVRLDMTRNTEETGHQLMLFTEFYGLGQSGRGRLEEKTVEKF